MSVFDLAILCAVVCFLGATVLPILIEHRIWTRQFKDDERKK